jgi:molecular chaperone GrpE
MTEATNDEEHLHEEAEELRKETAEGSPEVAEHDHVAELEKQLEEAKSKALYAAAEVQNVRRRMEKDVSDARAYATTAFARDMLAIKDHLDRALAAVGEDLRADKTAAQFLAGIESTARELESVFSRHGIERVPSIGEALDPHRHQAMIEIPTNDAEPGTIVEEMQPGYMMKDRLLRPALVAVAKKAD